MSSSSSSAMLYPSGRAPQQKHDLVCPQTLPREGLLLDSQFGLKSTAALFVALAQPPPPLKQLAVVMTYDATVPNMAKALIVIGFADTSSIKLIRQLMYSDSDVAPPPTQKTVIAVQRGDGQYASQLERYHVTNTPKFAKFMRRLQSQDLVAILAPDKEQRFGILVPAGDNSAAAAEDAPYTKQDFCAAVHMGRVDKVKDYLTDAAATSQNQAALEHDTFLPQTPPVPQTPPMDGDEPIWKPPEDEDDAPVWKPPDNDDDNGDSGGVMWQPPGGDDTGEGGGLWQPPGGASNGFAEEDVTPAWKPPPQDQPEENSRKRSYSDTQEEEEEDEKKKFHADSGAAAADAFYSGLTRSLDTRDQSRIFHMRAFNGWVKATQIQELNPRTKTGINAGMRVLDLACGKGGDLGKWAHHKRGIANYVGVDVARGSLKDAALRARKMRKKLPRCTFTCADLGHDVPGRLRSPSHAHMQKLMSWSLLGESEYESQEPAFANKRGGGISAEDKFDVISVQFAIHYMMQTRKRARRFFQTCSELLEVGGNLICTTIDARVVLEKLMDQGLDLHFGDEEHDDVGSPAVVVGDGMCKIQFTGDMVKRVFKALSKPRNFDAEELFGLEYTFTLVEGQDHGAGVGDAVNLPEWLNPIPVLEALANEAGLELVSAENFHEFFHNRKDPSENSAAHEALYNMKALDRNGSICADNWEISRMYCAIKFKKVRESKMVLDDEGVEIEEEDEEPEPKQEESKRALDPIKSKQILPKAMMKAKKIVGAKRWSELSSDEKKRLTQIELENLINPEW